MAILSRASYPLTADQSDFPVPFAYMARRDVQVYVALPGAEAGSLGALLLEGTDYQWNSTGIISTAIPQRAGSTVTILRQTPTEDLAVVFQRQATLSGSQLNKAFRQLFYAVQEARDASGLGALLGSDPISADLIESALGFTPAQSVYKALGEGAVSRPLVSFLGLLPQTPEGYGAVGDGIADDTQAVQAALNAEASSGGSVYFPGKYRVTADLTVPAGVNIVGDYETARGRPSVGSSASPDYSVMSSSLRLQGGAQVRLLGSSCVFGMVIYRQGIIFPATPASTSAAYSGTALAGQGDDISVANCLIMGFNKGFFLSGGGTRCRVYSNLWDNNNNIEITNSGDRAYLTDNHAWPFGTICLGAVWQNLIRPGKNIWLHDFLDWAGLANNFCYGYRRGFVMENVDSTILVQCSADNAFDQMTLHSGSIGIELIGNCYDTKLIGCQSAAQSEAGVHVNLTAGRFVGIHSHSSWGGAGPGGGHGILITSGNAVVLGPTVRGCKTAVATAGALSWVDISGHMTEEISIIPIQASVPTSRVRVTGGYYGNFLGNPVDSNIRAGTITAADPLPINSSSDDYQVSGAVNFGTLPHGWKGRTVYIQFQDALTIFSGAGSSGAIRLPGGTNLAVTPGQVVGFHHNGFQWAVISVT